MRERAAEFPDFEPVLRPTSTSSPNMDVRDKSHFGPVGIPSSSPRDSLAFALARAHV